MTKKLLSVLLALALLAGVCVIPAAALDSLASSGTSGPVTWTFNKSTGLLTLKGDKNNPKPMDDYNNSTKKSPWIWQEKIRTVVIEAGITSIGTYAFYGCPALEFVDYSTQLRSVGSYAFFGCSALETFTIMKQVHSVGYGSFGKCAKLSRITVTDGNGWLKSEDGVLFSADGKELWQYPAGKSDRCYAIPDGTETIIQNAFEGCTNLVTVLVPSSVETIAPAAFRSCTSLDTLLLGDGLKYIKSNAFKDTNVSRVICEGGTTWISALEVSTTENPLPGFSLYGDIGKCGDHAVYYLTNSGVLTLEGEGETYTDWDEDMNPADWSGWSDVKKAVVGEGITRLGDSAFFECASLTEVNLPKSLISVGERMFVGCTALTGIFVNADSARFKSEDGVLFTKDGNRLICYPAGKTETEYVVPNGTESIADGAFYGAANLKKITLPRSLKRVETDAFYGCDALANVRYMGDFNDWKNVKISATGNDALAAITPVYTILRIPLVVTAPEAGKAPQTVYRKPVLPTRPSIEDRILYDYHKQFRITESIRWSPSDTVFKEGETYTVAFMVDRETGYAWPDSADEITATVNGKPAKVRFAERFNETGLLRFKYAQVIYTFTPGMIGDVDGSGEITPADARLALRISLGLMKDGSVDMTDDMVARADADGKDGVQPADARLILRKSLGLVDPEWAG